MEAEHLANTASTSSTPSTSAPTISGPPTAGAQTMSTSTITQSHSSPSMPGPSGLSRITRPTKRPNMNHSSKSDSSTVYQSDSSSSSDSDESPTPKRRISLVPNSTLFRKENNIVKVTDSSTSTNQMDKFEKRKRLQGLVSKMSRTSAFYPGRTLNTKSSQDGASTSRFRCAVSFRSTSDNNLNNETRRTVVNNEETLNLSLDRNPRSSRDDLEERNNISRIANDLDSEAARIRNLDNHYTARPRNSLEENTSGPSRNRDEPRNIDQEDHPSRPRTLGDSRPDLKIRIARCRNAFEAYLARKRNNAEDRTSRSRNDTDHSFRSRNEQEDHLRNNEPSRSSEPTDLPLPLSRLRGISEGSLSSADEVINFSERTGREEPENPVPETETGEFSIENIYRNILSDLEIVRNTSRTDTNRNNVETSNILQSFSQRLENIMNQSDEILANLRQSMDMLLEPTQSTSSHIQPSTPTSPTERFMLRRPSRFHTRLPTTSRPSQSGSNASVRLPIPRGVRYNRNRHPRHMNINLDGVWRPFGDHNYPRDPENTDQQSNVEPISSLLTLSPRSPSRDPVESETSPEEPNSEPPRSSTPVPFPTDHNYPLSDSPHVADVNSQRFSPVDPNSNPIADHTYPRDPQGNRPDYLPPLSSVPTIESPLEQRIDPNSNPIADHTYPRIPQSSRSNPDYLAPLVSSLHSTISHISMQTNLLRRQVESIEIIDRARFEVFQLQEMRRIWEDIRRHITFLNTPMNDRRSNMSNVRQMMAWARISDPSPSSESAQSSTEQSTPEPSASTDLQSTSRSSASSSNESRPTLNPNSPACKVARFRQNIKKRCQTRLYWRRRTMRNEGPNLNPRRYSRGFSYRDIPPRQLRNPENYHDSNVTEVTVSLMIGVLVVLLKAQSKSFGRRDSQTSPDRSRLERRVLSERVIQNRLRAARQRLNQLNGFESHQTNYLDEPIEYSTLGSRNDWMRYETRLKLSIYIETFSQFVENRGSPIPPCFGDQIKILIELALLLTDLLLLQIMGTIPASSGSFLDPERETLAGRIEQLCTGILQTISHSRLPSVVQVLHTLRLNARDMISSLRLTRLSDRQHAGARSNYRNYRREAMLYLNRQLRNLYHYSNYIADSELSNSTDPVPGTSQESTNNSSSTNSHMSHVYRLGDLLARLRNVRGRLEQVSQSTIGVRLANNSSSATEHDPARSTDESPSDRESESFEGFGSGEYRDNYMDSGPGALYRTSHVNLYPPEQSSSQVSHFLSNIKVHFTVPNRNLTSLCCF